MEPVARRTRRRTEEALIEQYKEHKKAKTGSDQGTVVLSTSPSASVGSSTSSSSSSSFSSSSSSLSSSASVAECATPSRAPRDLKKEVEEEDVSTSSSDDTQIIVISSSSGSEDGHVLDDSDSDSESDQEDDDDDDEDDYEEEDFEYLSLQKAKSDAEEHVKPHETDDIRSSSSDSYSEGELDTKNPNQEEVEENDDEEEEIETKNSNQDEDEEEEEEEEIETMNSNQEEEEEDEEEEEEIDNKNPNQEEDDDDDGDAEEDDDDDDAEEDDDDKEEETEKGGGRQVRRRGGQKLMMKPLPREKKKPLAPNEIHRVLFDSIMEEANDANVDEKPLKKPHEREDTSSNSTDIDSNGETDMKKPEEAEELGWMYRMMDFHLVDDQDNNSAAASLQDDTAKSQEQLCKEGKHYLIEKGGQKLMMKPLRREKKKPWTANEIHRVLFNSIMEEANDTNVNEEPLKKPHEREDTSSNSSDVDSDGEIDTKNPEEEELDWMYRMMDFHLVDDHDNNSAAAAACMEDGIAKSQEQLCNEGKHYLILDEEIGIICKLCSHVREEIKHVMPPFHENPFAGSDGGRYSLYNYQDPKNLPSFEDPNINSQHSREGAEFDPTGTVWEIIPDIRKTLHPHQREAFEFIWRNVSGSTKINELTRNKTREGGGCLISHAPGTGKTRLAIAFLETHIKFCKSSRPVILAPAGILLTWKKEFEKWKVEVPFINLNDKDLSEKESFIAGSLFGKNYEKNLTSMAKRLIKMLYWKKHDSVLAISYHLFTKLAQEKKDVGTKSSSHVVDQKEMLRELLLEKPGLLILDEGHMPRNERSLVFKILEKVKTKKRVLLSGTPFQNNFRELYNLLCLVRKEFVAEENPFKKSGVDEADEAKIREFKEKIKPFYHHYNNYIVRANTPGLFNNVIYLQPSEHQNMLLKEEETEKNHLKANVNMTLISVHPMLLQCKDTSPDFLQELKNGSWNIDDGAKMKFLIRLIELSSALDEKVLVFSQYLHPLNFVKGILMSKDYFGWREGIEIHFMSGNQDMETRQRTMDYFNKSGSKAKVMLASTKACCEGIELIGASRVVLLDVTWNPSVEEQAISRAYRMGQKKVVHVYHLIMSDNDSSRHISQTQKKNFSDYMFLESIKKSGVVGSSKADCVDIILERLLEEKIIKEGTQEKASDHPGPSNNF